MCSSSGRLLWTEVSRAEADDMLHIDISSAFIRDHSRCSLCCLFVASTCFLMSQSFFNLLQNKHTTLDHWTVHRFIPGGLFNCVFSVRLWTWIICCFDLLMYLCNRFTYSPTIPCEYFTISRSSCVFLLYVLSLCVAHTCRWDEGGRLGGWNNKSFFFFFLDFNAILYLVWQHIRKW